MQLYTNDNDCGVRWMYVNEVHYTAVLRTYLARQQGACCVGGYKTGSLLPSIYSSTTALLEFWGLEDEMNDKSRESSSESCAPSQRSPSYSLYSSTSPLSRLHSLLLYRWMDWTPPPLTPFTPPHSSLLLLGGAHIFYCCCT